MYPHGVHVLNGTDNHHIVIPVAQQFQLVFFPAHQGLIDHNFVNGRYFQAYTQQFIKILLPVNNGSSCTPEGV